MIMLGDNERVDWFRIITDIKRDGVSMKELSQSTGIAEGTIKGWQLSGSRPNYECACKVLIFWSELCEQSFDKIPIYDMTDPARQKFVDAYKQNNKLRSMASKKRRDELLNTDRAAKYLGYSAGYMRNSRACGMLAGFKHPPFVKLKSTIRYRKKDLDAWLINSGAMIGIL